MRITTIFGTSITLATGVLIGWAFSSLNHAFTPSSSSTLPSSHSPYYPPVAERDPDLQQAERLLNAYRPIEALAILSGITPTIDLSSPNGKEWLRLLVDAYSATDNQTQLVLIYKQFPEALGSNEHAALAVADTLIDAQETLKYDRLRHQWQNRERELARWVFLDAQSKLIEGKNQEAVAILQANYFKGKDETDRLVRLAALHMIDDPKQAWNYLAEATRNDPKNPDLHTFKASLGESLNQDQIAHSDYIVAVQHDPENPYRREQLADFYLRTSQYQQALEILQDTMSSPSLDSIWLKTIFWSHVAVPVKDTWKIQDIPQGDLKDFVAYLLALPSGIYWDQQTFLKLPEYQTYLNTRQETFWLQLLSALKNGQEEMALKLLNDNTFQYVSWSPELERSLKTLLTYRISQRAAPTNALSSIYPRDGNVESPKQLLQLLANLSEAPSEQLPSAIPHQMQDYLLSKEAFTMPFLAIGWTETAIQLHAFEKLPDTFPSWIAESLTLALAQNRNSKTALNFALAQKATPSLSLLIAELALEADEKQIAFNSLKEIYTKNDESGKRAALILSQFLVEHDNLQDAKKAILAQPALANDVTAREILARIAVQEGDLKKAFSLYLGLEKESSEAKSFLARKAFAEKEWTRARQLTEALLKEHPENETLTNNLQMIIAEEKRRKIN